MSKTKQPVEKSTDCDTLSDRVLTHFAWWQSMKHQSMLMLVVLIFIVKRDLLGQSQYGLILFALYNWMMTSAAFFMRMFLVN